jgi:hypothetical protein
MSKTDPGFVHIGQAEARIMILDIPADVKALVFTALRELHNEEREERGLPRIGPSVAEKERTA